MARAKTSKQIALRIQQLKRQVTRLEMQRKRAAARKGTTTRKRTTARKRTSTRRR
ncbi:MAG: hypothetical protein IIA87_04380 [Nanoarchaeota archaeon]|nr:hypothetical protein [Nanoarchaeota archaeon]